MLVALALILKDGEDEGLTVIVTPLEVALVGDAQAKLEVITQVRISLLCKVVEE